MSLNKSLDRLFDEIRRETRRNPEFADRLDAVMRAHTSRRDVAVGVAEEYADEAPALNPVGLYQREGAAALAAALAKQSLPALRALVAEHNLDPSGETGGFARDALIAHLLDQARRRAERDGKLFDY